MPVSHLERLRKSLSSNQWVITSEEKGNDYDVSAVWKISRPNGDSPLSLNFEGQSEGDVLPIEKAYACHVSQNPDISLYFGKISKSFPTDLKKFMARLNDGEI